jgi:hypothetical protein
VVFGGADVLDAALVRDRVGDQVFGELMCEQAPKQAQVEVIAQAQVDIEPEK